MSFVACLTDRQTDKIFTEQIIDHIHIPEGKSDFYIKQQLRKDVTIFKSDRQSQNKWSYINGMCTYKNIKLIFANIR